MAARRGRWAPGTSSEWKGSILGGNIEYVGRPSPTPYQLGRRAEQSARRVLKREGYRCVLSPFSVGVADVWAVKSRPDAIGPTARLIQVKRYTNAPASWANEGVRYLLKRRVAEGVSRECWLHLGDSRAIVCRVVIDHKDRIVIEGREPWTTKTREGLQRVGLMP